MHRPCSSCATRRDLLEHLARLEPGRGAHGEAGGDPALEPGDPDHEELVEVAGEDREEAGPLEQRHARVRGELEHPLVELQPGDLAVEEAVGRAARLGPASPCGTGTTRMNRPLDARPGLVALVMEMTDSVGGVRGRAGLPASTLMVCLIADSRSVNGSANTSRRPPCR